MKSAHRVWRLRFGVQEFGFRIECVSWNQHDSTTVSEFHDPCSEAKGLRRRRRRKGATNKGRSRLYVSESKKRTTEHTHTHTIRDPADEKQCHPQMHGRECKLVIVILLMILSGCDFGRLLLLMVVSCW